MAWENRNPTLALAMLMGGDTVYKDMLKVAFSMKKLNNMVFFFETKKPNVDFSRNILTTLALRENCEWILFLDSDVIPPSDFIPRMLAHNLPIVTALYWRRYDELEPCIYKLSNAGIPIPFKNNELRFGSSLVEVEACGAGCMIIHNSVFRKMMPTVEKFVFHVPGTEEKIECHKFWEYIIQSHVNLSEDIVLSSRVKGLGYKIFVDISLRCGHLTNVMVHEGVLEQTPLSSGSEF